MIYNQIRRKTHQVSAGTVRIGGDAPIAIQSMTNTDTADVAATLNQIRELAAAGGLEALCGADAAIDKVQHMDFLL